MTCVVCVCACVCVQVVLAGGFAFDIIDRLSGGTLNVDPPEWAIQVPVRKAQRGCVCVCAREWAHLICPE